MKSLSVVNEKASREPPKPRFRDDPRPYAYAPDLGTVEGQIESRVVSCIKSVFDPEIPVNVFELGLIYGVDVRPAGKVKVRMTLTAPNCPVAQSMPEDIRQKALAAEGVEEAEVEVVWDPPWNPGMMSEAARLELNL
jgi:FeS assembly SUF system protein